MKLLSRNNSLPLIYQLVKIVFSIPVCNAFVNWVCSPVSLQCSKERNRINTKTVKSQMQVQVNLDFS